MAAGFLPSCLSRALSPPGWVAVDSSLICVIVCFVCLFLLLLVCLFVICFSYQHIRLLSFIFSRSLFCRGSIHWPAVPFVPPLSFPPSFLIKKIIQHDSNRQIFLSLLLALIAVSTQRRCLHFWLTVIELRTRQQTCIFIVFLVQRSSLWTFISITLRDGQRTAEVKKLLTPIHPYGSCSWFNESFVLKQSTQSENLKEAIPRIRSKSECICWLRESSILALSYRGGLTSQQFEPLVKIKGNAISFFFVKF